MIMEKINHSERKRLLKELLHETKVFYFVLGYDCGMNLFYPCVSVSGNNCQEG